MSRRTAAEERERRRRSQNQHKQTQSKSLGTRPKPKQTKPVSKPKTSTVTRNQTPAQRNQGQAHKRFVSTAPSRGTTTGQTRSAARTRGQQHKVYSDQNTYRNTVVSGSSADITRDRSKYRQRASDRPGARIFQNTGAAAKKGIEDRVSGWKKTALDIGEMASKDERSIKTQARRQGIKLNDEKRMAEIKAEHTKAAQTAKKEREKEDKIQQERQEEFDERTKGASGAEKALYGAAESGAGMLADLAVGAATGTGAAGSLASLGVGSYGQTRGSAKRAGATENEDRVNALLQAGKEVATERIFAGIGLAKGYAGKSAMSLSDRAAAKLTSKLTGRAANLVGAGARLAGGVAEENFEELVGWAADPLISEASYEGRVRRRRQDQVKKQLKAESDELRSQIKDENTARSMATYLSSNEFLEANKKEYMDSGLSEKRATAMAEQMRDYLTASLTGDTDEMERLEQEMATSIAGKGLSASSWDFGELADTAAATTLLTATTGLPGAMRSSAQGAEMKARMGEDGIKALAKTAIDFEDKEMAEKAELMTKRIESGKEITDTEAYDLQQGIIRQQQKDNERVTASWNSASTQIDDQNLVSPIVQDEDGTISIGKVTSDAVKANTKSAKTAIQAINKEHKGDTKLHLSAREVQTGADAIAAFQSGIMTADDANALTYNNKVVRQAFEETTGVDLSQYIVRQKNGEVDVPATNAATKDALFVLASENLVASAQAETVEWMDNTKGEVVTGITSRIGANGTVALQQALDTVDERNQSEYMLMANATDYLYQAGRNKGQTWDEVSSDFTEMFPEIDQSILKSAYNAGLDDKQMAEDKLRGRAVEVGKPMSEMGEQETATGNLFIDTKKALKGTDIRLFTELAKQLGADIHLVDHIKTNAGEANGAFNPKTNTFYINVSTGAETNFGYIFMHELTHYLKVNAPEQYLSLENLVREKWFDADASQMQDAIAKKVSLYKGEQSLTEEEALEEIIADAAHEFLNDRNFAKQVAEEDPTIAKALLDCIRKALRMLRNLFTVDGLTRDDTHMNALFSQLDILTEAEALWLDAYKAAVRNRGNMAIEEMQDEIDGNIASEMEDRFSIVEDPELIKQLEADSHMNTYRAMAQINGKLYPPMATQIRDENGEWKLNDGIELGQWVESDITTDPKMFNAKGQFILKKDNGRTVPAAYNPYIHSSDSMLNDQFSTAYKRQNVVVVEGEIPESELTSGYRAEHDLDDGRHVRAKDTTGSAKWKPGIVEGQLPKDRQRTVYLTNHFKPTRIVPAKEVAEHIRDKVEGTDVVIPYNVVNPDVRRELRSLGVPMEQSNQDMYYVDVSEDQVRFSVTPEQDADYMDAVNRGDMETAQRMVDQAAKAAGYDTRVFHGSDKFGFTSIDNNAPGADGFSFWSADREDISATYTRYGKQRPISKEITDEDVEEMQESVSNEIDDAIDRFRKLIDNTFSEWFFGQQDNSYLRKSVYDSNPTPGYGDGVYDTLDQIVAEAYYDYRDDYDFDEWQESDEAKEIYETIVELEALRSKADELERGEIGGGVYGLYANTDNLYRVDAKGNKWNELYPEGLPKKEIQWKFAGDEWTTEQPYRTREVAEWARNNGYDGVVFENIKDNGAYGRTEAGSVYAFFNPQSQVKSADPVTYDDNGNVIPLSERFNESNEDIRYSISEADVEMLDQTNSVVEDENGDPVAAFSKDGSVRLSVSSYDEKGRKIYRDYLKKMVKSGELSQEEADDMAEELENIFKISKAFADTGKYVPYTAWSYADVIYDEKGKPVFSSIKKNSEYKMNIDFSTICKKRRTLDAVFREMVKRGMFEKLDFNKDESAAMVVNINDLIRQHNFEAACALCFVEARRYRQQQTATAFRDLWNGLVESMYSDKSKIAYFNFGQDESVSDVAEGIHTMDNADLDLTYVKKVANERKKDGKLVQTAEAKAARLILKDPSQRKLMRVGDMMASTGFENMQIQNPKLMKIYNSKKGTGGAKSSFGDVQYLNEIIRSKTFNRKSAYAVSGVRIQSFSDYVARMVFDYVQVIADLAAKKLPAHAYTKEVLFAYQFGLTGTKINMSLVPDVVEDSDIPGLDAQGNYVWNEDGTFPYDKAIELQNAEGYRDNCGTIAVGISDQQIIKMLADPNIQMVIPYHKSSLNPIVAAMTNVDRFTDYTDFQNTKGENGKTVSNDFDWDGKLFELSHDKDGNRLPKSQWGNVQDLVKEYVDWCNERNYTPKFSQFLYMEDGSINPGYYKLLEDFALLDSEGNFKPQDDVKMKFPTESDAFGSMASLIEQGLSEDTMLEEKRAEEVSGIVDEIEKMYENGTLADQGDSSEESTVKFSIAEKYDDDYMSAVESGNMDEAQRLVDEAAKVAGYDTKVYHGTGANFTVFDPDKSGANYNGYSKYGKGLYFTSSEGNADYWGKGRKVIGAYLKTRNLFTESPLVTNEVLMKEFNRLRREKDPWLVNEYKKRGKAFDVETDATGFVFQIINEFSGDSGYTTELLKSLGYDGVKVEHGGMVGVPTWTEYVVFDPEQIKSSDPVTYAEDGSVIPLSERFDPNNNDIRYSLPTQDSEGNILTDGQMEFFKESQARDRDGKMAVVYHTTNKGGFTVFDPAYSDDGKSLFFTSNRRMSESYIREGQPGDFNPYEENTVTRQIKNVYYLPDFESDEVEQRVRSHVSNIRVTDLEGNVVAQGDDFVEVAANLLPLLEDEGYEDASVSVDLENRTDGEMGAAWEVYSEAINFGFEYTMDYATNGDSGTYTCYLNLKNPLVIEGNGSRWNFIGYGEPGKTNKFRDVRMDLVPEWTQDADGEPAIAAYEFRLEYTRKDEDGWNKGLEFITLNNPNIDDAMWLPEEELLQFLRRHEFNRDALEQLLDNENPMDGGYEYKVDGEVTFDAYSYYSTRDLCQIAYYDGHDGVIFRDIVDYGASGYGNKPGDVYVAFDSAQVKDVNNENPTDDPDIRFSFTPEDDALEWLATQYDLDDVPLEDEVAEEGRIRMAKSKEEYMHSRNLLWNDRWLTEGKVLKDESVEKSIRQLVMANMKNSDPDRKYKTEVVDKLVLDARSAFRMLKDGKAMEAEKLLWDSAYDMVTNLELIDDSTFEKYKDLREYLRNTIFRVGEEYWQDINYREYKSRNNGRIKLVKGNTNIDSVYHEMQELWPEWFDDSEQLSVPDQLMQIEQVLDAIQPYRYAYSSEEATDLAYDIASDLWVIIYDGEELSSIADEYKNRYDEKTKAMKARHKEALRKVKEAGDLKVLKEKAKFKEYKEKKKNAKEKAKHVGSLQKNINWLTERLVKETKDKNIPEQFRRSLAHLLMQFDMQTERSKQLEEKYGVAKKQLRIRELKRALEKISKEDDTGEFGYDEHLFFLMDELADKVDGESIDTLDMEDLIVIDTMLKEIVHEFRNYTKAWKDGKQVEIAEIGDKTIEAMDARIKRYGQRKSRTGVAGMFDKLVNEGEETPIYLFDRLDPKGEGIGAMYKELRRGEDQHIRNMNFLRQRFGAMFSDYFNKKKPGSALEKWRDGSQEQTFDLKNGSITLNPAQIMSLYCLSKRPQALGHILGAGIVASPVNVGQKLRESIRGKAEQVNSVMVTYDEVQQIISTLTPEQKKLADEMQSLMNNEMAAWGNETSMKLHGIRMFREKNYFPIRSSNESLTKTADSFNTQEKIKNFGFTKPLVQNANNAIMVDDIFSVVADHCNKMSLYNAMAVPISDFMRVYNYKQRNEDGSTKTVQQAIGQAFTRKVNDYIMKFIADLNSNTQTRSDAVNDLMNKALANYKRAAIGLNMRVALQQPTAIFRSFMVIDPKWFVGVVPSKKAMDEMFEHCPIALWKSWGHYDMDMGRDIEDVMMNNDWSVGDVASMGLYGALDNVTWSVIWQAVKKEVKANNPSVEVGSDEFWKLCNERASEVFDKTQVVDSIFHRSDVMRSRNTLTKMAVSFMAEPTLTWNVFRDSLAHARDMLKDGDIAGAGKILMKMTSVLALNAMAVSGAAAIWDAVRGKSDDDDDEEKKFSELWFENFIKNLGDNANLINNIYFVSDVLDIWEGVKLGWGGTSNMALEGFETFFRGIEQFRKKANGEYKEWNEPTWYDIFMNIGGGLGYITGKPIKTFMRDAKAIGEKLNVPVFAADGTAAEVAEEADGWLEKLREKLPKLPKLPEISFGNDSESSEESEESSESDIEAKVEEYKESLGDEYTEDQKKSLAKQYKKTLESESAEEAEESKEDDTKYQLEMMSLKAQQKANEYTGDDLDEKLWDVVSDGYTKRIAKADFAYISKMREIYVKNGGDVDKFDEKIMKQIPTAYKKLLSSDMSKKEIKRQELLKEYMLSHGVSDAEISDMCYHTYMASDLKAAIRMNNEEYIMDELVPLVRAGLSLDDFHKIVKYVNYGAKSYDGKYSDPKYKKSTGTYVWPAQGPITSYFGYRNAPTAGASSNHPAIDIGASQGSPVVAADGGTVISAGNAGGYGNQVAIQHENGAVTYYSHLYGWNVKVGDQVSQGQQIGQVGSTGISTGPHLDFKVEVNGQPVDPLKYLSK